jgi:hypothetical protein
VAEAQRAGAAQSQAAAKTAAVIDFIDVLQELAGRAAMQKAPQPIAGGGL